jgi:predicted permease
VRAWHILRSRVRSVFFRDSRESDLREELQFHLEREAERLQRAGMAPATARATAIKTFGTVEPIKEECRDARGTMLLDTVVRDLRFTWRSLQRTPLVALTIVTTVGLGLGLVTVVFTILNGYVFRVDAVQRPEELFAVQRQPSREGVTVGFTRAEYDAFVRDTDVFADAFATTSDVAAWIDGTRREGRLVSGNFFRLLGVTTSRGRVLMPSDDVPGAVPAVVLSHRAWSQHYASDPGILNRTVLLNGSKFQIVGIGPEGFRGLEPIAAPDFWAPLSLLDEFARNRGRENPVSLHMVGRLKPGLTRGQALAQVLAWDSNRAVEYAGERPPTRLVLEPRPGTMPLSGEVMLAFMPLFFAFGLILMIGCANVGNLLLARAVARQSEIGIRLAIGASRRRIIFQLLTESLLLALVAAALAYGLARAALAAVQYAVVSTFPPDLGNIRVDVPPADWRVALFLVGGAIVSTALFALAPALQATRRDLVRSIRGEVLRDARPGRTRHALIALQATGSALLLILAAVFLRSSWAAARHDPGVRTADTFIVSVVNEQRRGAILDMVRSEPSVASVAATWPRGLEGLGGPPALAEGRGGKSRVTYHFVSPEYFGVLGIDLVRGRNFTDTEQNANAAVAVVSERVARELWPGADAVGQTLRLEPIPDDPRSTSGDMPFPARSFTVVGIARDVPGFRLGGFRMEGAGVSVPIGASDAKTSLTVRVRGDSERARHTLVDRFAAIDPNMAEIATLRTLARTEAYLLGIPFWLTLILGGLALALTLSGLFSVLSYLVEQRTREIGVRMALGATRGSIARLVLSESARPVALGLLLGGSFTAALGAVLLASPAAEQIGSSVRLLDPVAYVAAALAILGACACAAIVPALRATRIDPVVALRES